MKTRWLFLTPIGLLLVLQAFPIDRSSPETDPKYSLHQTLQPPDAVLTLLKNSCYDCHSNHTRYPWYSHIQPIGWWIQNHVKVGRQELNFADFGQWDAEDQADILRHCIKMVKKEVMPLGSYLRMHPEAHMNSEQKNMLLQWLADKAKQLESSAGLRAYTTVKDTCDDSDANPRCCFNQMPDQLSSILTIAPEDEPGQRIKIEGRFFQQDGKTPYANVLVYAYQTDCTGRYTRKGDETGILRWHGRLHAWGRTDATGRYEIQSIRPAAYPGRSNPAHIHAVVWEPGAGKEPYYIPDFLFADDPLLSARERADGLNNPTRSPVVTLTKQESGPHTGKRDIILK
jgi:protocatechuate 3,4-dioxygenase beta subunit